MLFSPYCVLRNVSNVSDAETSQISTQEMAAGAETSQVSTQEMTAGAETSQVSTQEMTAGAETSQVSTQEMTAEAQTSQVSTQEPMDETSGNIPSPTTDELNPEPVDPGDSPSTSCLMLTLGRQSGSVLSGVSNDRRNDSFHYRLTIQHLQFW